jgi:triosephosphate isomerase (TIM)
MKTIIAANWKMHKTADEAMEYMEQFARIHTQEEQKEIVFFPATMHLPLLKEGGNIKIGAQNIHTEQKGAYTGETSIRMIAPHCSWVLVGHSERRREAHESNKEANKKAILSLENGKNVMFCIGENKEQRTTGKTESVLKEQLEEGLKNIHSLNNIAIAYEPSWAISNGDPLHKTATPEDAKQAAQLIRSILKEKYQNAEDTPILYGGSVKRDSVGMFTSLPNINGVLVGGASLDAEHFSEIIKRA